MKNRIYIIAGFVFLFIIYHFPEFFSAFWIMAVFKIGFLAAAVLLSRLQGWAFLEGYGFSFSKAWYRGLFTGLLIGFGAFALSIFLSVGLHVEQLKNIQPAGFFFQQLPLVLFMTFFPSIAEDILTRGYLFGHLKSLKPMVWILVSAALYVLNHIWRLGEGLPVLSYLFLLGLVLAFCVILKRSLWMAFGIHWGANIAYELSRSGIETTTVAHTDASTWILALVWGLVLAILTVTHRNSLNVFSS